MDEEYVMYHSMHVMPMAGCPMCSTAPNRPVPYAQSPTAMNEGYAVQVRQYPETPETEPLRISGKVR